VSAGHVWNFDFPYSYVPTTRGREGGREGGREREREGDRERERGSQGGREGDRERIQSWMMTRDRVAVLAMGWWPLAPATALLVCAIHYGTNKTS